MNRDTLLALALFGVAGWLWWSKSGVTAAAAASSPGVLSPPGAPPQTAARIPAGARIVTWEQGLQLEAQGFTRIVTLEGVTCWQKDNWIFGVNHPLTACALISFDVERSRQPFLP